MNKKKQIRRFLHKVNREIEQLKNKKRKLKQPRGLRKRRIYI